MIIYRNRLKFWRLRCVILKSAFQIGWAILYVILDMPVLLATVLFIVPLPITIYVFVSKKADIISGLTFDDEKKLLAVEYYRYCFKKTTVDIPYEKLFYLKDMSQSFENFLFSKYGEYDEFHIEIREDKSQPASVSLACYQGIFLGPFSKKDFFEILETLDKVGQSL